MQNVSGSEDTAIPLTISGGLTDIDGSESLSFVISGVPTGAVLSKGTYAGGGKWSLTAADLSGLTLTPPSNYSGSIALTVKAVATEHEGPYATASATLNVTVTPVADQPSLLVAAARGNEDTAIPLSITSALIDADGSESLSITISGVPTGAVLNQGTNLGGDSWKLTAAQLSGLTLTPPAQSDSDFTLTVTATSTESGGGTATRNTTLAVTVSGVADAPVATAANVSGSAGAQIALTLGGTLIDADGSESALTYVVHGIPDGFALNQGFNNGDNTWTLTQAQLSGLKLITPPTFEGQVNMYVTAVAHEGDGAAAMGAATPFYARVGNWSTGYLVDIGIGVNIGGIGIGVHVGVLPDIDLFPASGGILGVNGIYAKENTPFLIADGPSLLGSPLISAILGTVAKIQFVGVPTGTTFSAGTNLGGGVWEFTQAQLTNLYMTPPSNSDSDFTILARAKLLSTATIDLISAPVHLLGIANMPSLTASAGSGTEDSGSIALTISGALADTDGSETSSFLISGLPSGFMLNHGINNSNGTWSLSSSDLTGLTMTPAANWSGSGTFTVSHIATEREGDQAVKQVTVNYSVTAVADSPLISTRAHNGTEDVPLSLNFGISLTDADGSESISSLTVSGVPVGGSLTNATNNGDGTWSVNVAQIGNVQLVPPIHWHGDTTLNFTAVARESANGATASLGGSLAIHMDAVAHAPTISAANATDQPNTLIALAISAGLTDNSEHLSIVISGMPDGAQLSAGLHNADGSWTLTQPQLAALSIPPPAGFNGDMHLTATAYSFEDNGLSSNAHQDFVVHVDYDHAFHG